MKKKANNYQQSQHKKHTTKIQKTIRQPKDTTKKHNNSNNKNTRE